MTSHELSTAPSGGVRVDLLLLNSTHLNWLLKQEFVASELTKLSSLLMSRVKKLKDNEIATIPRELLGTQSTQLATTAVAAPRGLRTADSRFQFLIPRPANRVNFFLSPYGGRL